MQEAIAWIYPYVPPCVSPSQRSRCGIAPDRLYPSTVVIVVVIIVIDSGGGHDDEGSASRVPPPRPRLLPVAVVLPVFPLY